MFILLFVYYNLLNATKHFVKIGPKIIVGTS
jgi:hypothetical protein